MGALLSRGLYRPRVGGDRVAHARDRRRPLDGARGPAGARGAGARAGARHAGRRGAGRRLQLLRPPHGAPAVPGEAALPVHPGRGADKLAVARRAGADVAIDYRSADWVDQVRAATDGHGADVIYDPVGGDVFDASLKCIAWNGRLLVIGFASGRIPEVKLNRVLLKNIALVGLHWGAHALHQPERIAATLAALLALYRGGQGERGGAAGEGAKRAGGRPGTSGSVARGRGGRASVARSEGGASGCAAPAGGWAGGGTGGGRGP